MPLWLTSLGSAPAPPRVLLACLGTLAEHSPRAMFAANLFAAGGFDVVTGRGTGEAGPEDAARALAQEHAASGAALVCLCGSDAAYSTHAVAAVTALHGAGAKWTVYAGRPRHTEHEAELRDAGVDVFVHAGCDAVVVLHAALQAAGVTVTNAATEMQR